MDIDDVLTSNLELDSGSVIVAPSNTTSTVLTYITFAFSSLGIAMSAMALFLLLLTAFLFVEWRKNYKNQLLIQFMIARFLYAIIRYCNDITIAFDLNRMSDFLINLDLLLLFYTETTLVYWMFVFSKQMYDGLVTVFSVEKHAIWKVSLCSWLIPLFLSLPFYSLILCQQEDKIRVYIIFMFIVKWPVLLANAYLLIMVLHSVIKTNKSRTENNWRIGIIVMGLIFLFCVQQIIGDIFHKLIFLKVFDNVADIPTSASIGIVIFNIMALYHCAGSIMFWLFGNEQTRKLWKYRLNQTKQTQVTALSVPRKCHSSV